MKIESGTFEATDGQTDTPRQFGDTIVIRSVQSTLKVEEKPKPTNEANENDAFSDISVDHSVPQSKLPTENEENPKTDKKKGSVLKRLAAKFNPSQRKRENYTTEESDGPVNDESLNANKINDSQESEGKEPENKSIEVTLDDIQIKSVGIDDGTITSTINQSKVNNLSFPKDYLFKSRNQ